MAVTAKTSQTELQLLELIKNPVLCGEFLYNMDLDPVLDKPFEFAWYQKEILCDFNPHVSIATSRAVGKCLHKDSRILNPKTGEYRTVEDWFLSGELSKILSINDNWKQEIAYPIIEPNGIKDCLEISLVGGAKTIVTFEHPILTNNGFVNAENLDAGMYVACAKDIPYFGTGASLSDNEIKIVAHFIAEGTYKVGSITTISDEVIEDIYEYAHEIGFGVRKYEKTYYISNGQLGKSKNPYIVLLENLGLRYKHSFDKYIPQEIFSLPKEKLGLFLNRLFGDDGWCISSATCNEIGYATTSEILARDIKHLLLRFGITSSLARKKNKKLGAWSISIKGKSNLKSFRDNIGFHIQYKKKALDSAILRVNDTYNQADVLPIPDYSRYKKLRKSDGDKSYPANLRYAPSRTMACNIINKDPEFEKFANSDIYWSKVKSTNVVPAQETYSIEVSNNSTHLVDNIWSHNTVSQYSLLLWVLLYKLFPDDYILYTVPSKVHLEPVFSNLVRLFRTNTLLKNFIDTKSGVNNSEFKITLKNGSVLLCRIAGQSGTGANLISLHTPWIEVDEAGYFPWSAFQEMQPSLNTWTPGYREIVSGVPTGMRENNVLYAVDMENDVYTKHRASTYDNPRITDADIEALKEQYGGEESEDFIHYVLGQHGRPVFSLFDRSLFKIETYPIYQLKVDGLAMGDVSEILAKIDSFPMVSAENYGIVIGIDLGYTEPTAIIIQYIDDKDRLRFHGRIRLAKVSYPVQEKIIDAIDTKFSPLIIGMDKGNAGMAVIQNLQEHADYLHKNYRERLYPIDFSSSVSLGVDKDGGETKVKAKPFFVSILQEMSNAHRIVYSFTDPDMITELERMTYSKNPNGDISYKTVTVGGGKRGEDHFTSALLCGVGAFHMTREFSINAPKVKLVRAIWV